MATKAKGMPATLYIVLEHYVFLAYFNIIKFII